VIDVALGGHGRTHPFVDDLQDLEQPFPPAGPSRDAIPAADGRGGLRRGAVHADVAATASLGGLRPCLVEANRPEPAV